MRHRLPSLINEAEMMRSAMRLAANGVEGSVAVAYFNLLAAELDIPAEAMRTLVTALGGVGYLQRGHFGDLFEAVRREVRMAQALPRGLTGRPVASGTPIGPYRRR